MNADKHPSEDECLELLERYHTPLHVRKHCIAVSNVALALAKSLNENGFNLNLPLIQASGLLHDIARVEDEHWNKGADLVLKLGFAEEAKIIRAHMFYSFPLELKALAEIDMVCLGDRLVKEDKFVGLNVRMEYILNKAEYKNKHAQQVIREEMEHTCHIIEQIEDLVGDSLEDIIGKNSQN